MARCTQISIRSASHLLSDSFVPIWIAMAALSCLVGCQQQSVTTTALPQIVLDGPRFPEPKPIVLAPPATLPSLSIVTVKPPAPARKPAEIAVPVGWVPDIPPRPWQWIIIHHSATTFGNAQIIDGWHRNNGWDELGYHFVIGNGSNSADGQVEIGPRWPKQKWGAHTKTADNRFNDFGIGICLVGNFDEDRPTAAQLKSVATLVAHLMKTYHISADHVIGHGEAKPTDCPGRYLSVSEVVRLADQILVAQAANQDNPVAEEKAAGDPAIAARLAAASLPRDDKPTK